MYKLLVICGPTATGKTGLGLHLAKKFDGELVSADSRQVYKGMDIGTGKDLPVNAKWQMTNVKSDEKRIGFYRVSKVRVWGYDLVSPKERFSVADYIRIATTIIKDVWNRGRLPILVGGTGLYIKGVIEGIPTASVPRNESLRKSLGDKGVKDLFEMLARVDPIKAASMNISDRKNPRRLIRAIEVAMETHKNGLTFGIKKNDLEENVSPFYIGLKAPRDVLHQQIKKRTNKRLKQGIEKEIQNLLKEGVVWRDQAMNSLGYKQWKLYLDGKSTKEEVIAQWQREEFKYAKRQMVWFKSNRDINWFDISKENWRKGVEKLVKEWYKSK